MLFAVRFIRRGFLKVFFCCEGLFQFLPGERNRDRDDMCDNIFSESTLDDLMISMIENPVLPPPRKNNNNIPELPDVQSVGTTVSDEDDDADPSPHRRADSLLLYAEWSNAQLKSWSLAQFDQYYGLLSGMQSDPLPPADEKRLKAIRRTIKNRESAARSRKRKKEYVQSMEKKIPALERELKRLRKESLEEICILCKRNKPLVCPEALLETGDDTLLVF